MTPTITNNNTGCPPIYPFSSSSQLPCSGHGTCTDATNSSLYFTHLCICDSGWSGASDLFDLIVARHHITNAPLSLDCTTNVSVTYFLYASLLIVYLLRQTILGVALVQKIKRMPLKQRRASQFFFVAMLKYMPIRVLLCDFFISNPLVIAFSIQRLATIGTSNEMVLGTSPSLTVTYSLGVFLTFTFFSDFTMNQFQTMANSRMLKKEFSKKIILTFFKNLFVEWVVYSGVYIMCPILALSTDKAQGPFTNKEYVILVVRNMGVVFMMTLRGISSYRLKNQVEAVLIPSNGISGPHHDNSSAKHLPTGTTLTEDDENDSESKGATTLTAAVARVLAYIKHKQNEMRVTALSIGSISVLFSVPQFWSYQMIGYCVSLSLATITNNAGVVFLKANRQAALANKARQNADAGKQIAPISPLAGATPAQDHHDMTSVNDVSHNHESVG